MIQRNADVMSMQTESQKTHAQQPSAAGFTLIEMLSVVAIIALLAVTIIGIVGYVEKKTAEANAKMLMSSLEAAIEWYKADTGAYPISSTNRLISVGDATTNSWRLYQQLTTPKRYYQFRPEQIQLLILTGVTRIIDPWGAPINYFNPADPALASGVRSNKHSYDLYSSGRDRIWGSFDDVINWN